jgi:alpha-beta hydrolase superfamily lysophospholipase
MVESHLGLIQPQGFPGLPEDWSSEWETFRSADEQLALFGVLHSKAKSSSAPARALIVIHGHGEHGGRYLHVPHFVREDVSHVYCLDLRGHGRSEGLRGDIERFDLFAEDVAHAIRRLHDRLEKKRPGTELHLLGHSLGGHISLRALFLHPKLPIRSASISAPFLGVKQRVPLAKRLGARVLSHVYGTLQLKTELDPAMVSHDPAVVEAYKADRLCHDKMTPRFYTGMVEAWNDTMRRESGMEYPVQFLIPMADEIVDAAKSVKFFQNLKHRDKRLKQYAGFFHEPFNEIGKEQVFGDLLEWIRDHSRQAAPPVKS